MSFFSGNDPDRCSCGGIDCRACKNEFPCRLDDYIIDPQDLGNHFERREYPAESLAFKLGLCIDIHPEYLEIIEFKPMMSGDEYDSLAEVLTWREAYLWLNGYQNFHKKTQEAI